MAQKFASHFASFTRISPVSISSMSRKGLRFILSSFHRAPSKSIQGSSRLHYSGPLLAWIEKHRPEYFARLKELSRLARWNSLVAGFYEHRSWFPFLRRSYEQITRLGAYLEKHFGRLPSGAWLASGLGAPASHRSWRRNVAYTSLTTCISLLLASSRRTLRCLPRRRPWQDCIALPGTEALRYLIPFGKVEDVIAYLRDAASVHPDGVAAMGDDMEKFGVWPPERMTNCYKDGWLSDFFTRSKKTLIG